MSYRFSIMVAEDFQFDLAIQSELTKRIKMDSLLKNALSYPEFFFCFEDGILYIDLGYISQSYYAEHIEFSLAHFCYLLGRKLQQWIGEFFLLYDFPSVKFPVEVRKKQIICKLSLNVEPKFFLDNDSLFVCRLSQHLNTGNNSYN